ncbi:MAG: zinc-dependent metalloprotease [Saprospiraceae bacterium]|nr:zinc-dependent metalloprotease [Saprospiraceae bacterium]MCF8251796.1 zinc-dependent metalloprotease [Saprospiraceae bacterium]MCF8281450.1 zinc-dependent metalloprotease [Bacteroidales bacterium]MCF8313510.1 zinc-dependent metalloprotease [Saprospiraceae bacterium]MCF8442267.1 zinc-dependent metalloprotease [Saprospiraceae bacterium]
MRNEKNYTTQTPELDFRKLPSAVLEWIARYMPQMEDMLKSFVLLLLASSLPFGATLFSQNVKPKIIHECSTFTPPVEALAHEQKIASQLATFTEEYMKEGGAKMATVVPIHIHIVRRDDGTGGINVATVQSEIANYVNTRYSSIGVSFQECSPATYINSTAYYDLSGDPEGDAMSAAYNVPNVLNLYFVNDPDGACGWARFTFLLPSDYVVIANGCADNTSTLAHEIGHYFDLFHTHETAFGAECVDGSNCAVAGDLFCDTPADPVLSGKVTAYPGCGYVGADLDPCNNDPYTPSTHNIMSYSQKQCRDIFTAQQNAKILFTIANGRSYLDYGCAMQVPGDDCADAIPISCGDMASGSTVDATLDGPAQDCFGLSVAPDVWYTMLGTGGNITASLCGAGTNYDSKIDIYTGTCGALSSVVCNDDFCGLQSQVTWASTLGVPYLIRVHGFIGGTGNYTLSITCPVTLTCPGDMTVASCQTQADVDGEFATWLASATASGGCNGVLMNNNQGPPSICGGSTTVTFTYTSSCSPLQTNCTATFTVTAPPTVQLNCPGDMTVAACQTHADVDGEFAAWLASAYTSGGCNGVLMNNNQGPPSICGGSTTVTFTYTSSCFPFQTNCPATFTVTAPQPVVLVCPVNTTASPCLTQAQVNTAYATWLASATASGGCNGVLSNNNALPAPTICNQQAATRTVTWTYTSSCFPFTTTCTATFTLQAYPDFAVPVNGAATVPCPANATQPTPPVVLDACGKTATRTGPVITNNPNPLTCEGTRTYTWTYSDCAGHSHQWSFVYTVVRLDFGVPPNSGSTVACPGQTDVQPTPPVVFSNCGEQLTPVLTSVTPKPGCEGNRNYTWTYTDCAGHSHQWTYIYTVKYLDFTVPANEIEAVECPLNVVVPTPPVVHDNCGNLLNAIGPVITSTNNAGGCEASRTYAWTYTDCTGRTHTWSKTFNFLYSLDFDIYPSKVAEVTCVDHAVTPFPPTVYDWCGNATQTALVGINKELANGGCSGVIVYSFNYFDCGGHTHPWTFTYLINDNVAPTGTCPDLDVTDLACIGDVPCPQDDFSALMAKLLQAGNFKDNCTLNLNITLDSWTDLWDCSDADGDGAYTFGRTFYFLIEDNCGNAYPELCSVTYSGECQPIQSFSQKAWGDENGMPGTSMGISNLTVIQNLLTSGGPIKVGGTNRSLSISQAQCVLDMLPATGGPSALASCHQNNCPGCNPMAYGGLKNSLAGGMIALNLSMRYSSVYNGANMNAMMTQGLGCMEVHPCIKTCDEGGNCLLHLFDDGDTEYLFPYTLGGLMEIANLYLDGGINLSIGQQTLYGTALNQAVGAANAYWSANGAAAHACNADYVPDGGGDASAKSGSPVTGDKLEYSLAPNPAGNEVKFILSELAEQQAVVFEIYNQLGQQVLRRDFGVVSYANERIDLSGIGAGLYIVSVRAGEQGFEQKLVVSK